MRPIAAILLFSLFVLTACSPGAEEAKGPAPAPPNVVFILADDLGYSDLSCTGSDFYETPNIDRIAAMGVTFTNGYANCQVCSPSRASLLTGQSPTAHGITDWIGAAAGTDWRDRGRHDRLLPPDYARHLPAESVTLPEAFREAGYRTFFAGKWHLGGDNNRPTDHGFDHNVGGFESGSPRGGYFSPYANPELADGPAGENLTLRLARETADFIGRQRDSTFFAYLSFYAVHAPIQSSRAKFEKYREKARAAGVADGGYAMERVLPYKLYQDQPVYAGLVEQLDDAVGIVLDTLTALGLLDNTIIVFTSDNGGVVSGDGYATNLSPLRGGKGYQWEGGIKVPYLLYAPGREAAAEIATPVIGADLYPTLLELAGLPLRPEDHRDGISLLPSLAGEAPPGRDLIWHYPHYGNQGGEPSSIIRRGEYKLILYYEDGRSELYYLPNDPGERNDLAAAQPARAAELRAALLAHLEEREVRTPTADPEFDPEARAQVLRGYREELLPRLEGRRRARFAPDWQPNEDWWGSEVTVD